MSDLEQDAFLVPVAGTAAGSVVRWGTLPPVAARVNWGRWIVDCAACTSALAVRRTQDVRYALAWGAEVAYCLDCGARLEVRWPDDAMRSGVERILLMRPDPNTRNWSPEETLADLLEENAAHGLFDGLAAADLDGPRLLFAVDGGRVVVDELPALEPAALEPAAVSRQIGA